MIILVCLENRFTTETRRAQRKPFQFRVSSFKVMFNHSKDDFENNANLKTLAVYSVPPWLIFIRRYRFAPAAIDLNSPRKSPSIACRNRSRQFRLHDARCLWLWFHRTEGALQLQWWVR